MVLRNWKLVAALAASLMFGAVMQQQAVADEIGEKIRAVTAKASESMVVVSFYIEQADGSRNDLRMPGCVVGEGNLVMTTSLVFNSRLPLEQYKEFEVIVYKDGESKSYAAEYQGRDDTAQVAFLRIVDEEAPTLPALEFSRDAVLEVGDPFVTFGNMGEADAYKLVVSMGRTSTVLDKPFRLYIMSGTSGSPGMPVIALDGKVVGIVGLHAFNRGTMARPNAQTATVIWPTERFADRLADVPQGGQQVKRPWMGVASMTAVTRDTAVFFGLGDERGVIIGQVLDDSPASAAGLKSEDIVLAIDGKQIVGVEGQLIEFFQNEIQRCKIGQEINLVIFRGGERQELKLTLGEEPKRIADAKRYRNRQFGFNVREMVLQDTLARELPNNETGVVVEFVEQSGWAQDGGLKTGDIVKRVQDQEVKNLAEFEKVFSETTADKPAEVVLFVLRGSKTTHVVRIEPRWSE